MTEKIAIEPPRLYPTFRYRDAARMIDWLCETFGFAVRSRHEQNGRVLHAELTFGASMIMLGDTADDAYGAMVGGPGEAGGKSVYVAVDDPDMLHARARSAGATMLQDLTERDYGSRDFICADPEGNVWCFGTYWPKAHEAPEG